MPYFDGKKVNFNEKHRQTLNAFAKTLDDNPPGTILTDFETLLELVEGGLKVTSTHRLKLARLEEINNRLTHPVELGLTRPQQKSYPHINGLFLLLRASGLTVVDETGKSPKLVLDKHLLQQWHAMSTTEKYFNLLEAWLIRGRESLIGEHERFGGIPDHLTNITFLLHSKFKDKSEVTAKDDKDLHESVKYFPGLYNIGLLDLFGWIELAQQPVKDGDSYQVASLRMNDIGRAFIEFLSQHYLDNLIELQRLDLEPVTKKYGYLKQWLQPYFPKYKAVFELPTQEKIEGVRIIKVSLGKVWRRIAIAGEHSFDYLAREILSAFNFDFDHLYEFIVRGRAGETLNITHPHMNDGFDAGELQLDDVLMSVGQSIDFVFDFGDNWQFSIVLEDISQESDVKTATVLEEHGKAPKQYSN